jgi:hypothetical protein
MSFRLLFGLLIMRRDRREIVWLGVTWHPTAEWIARQLTEALAGTHRRSICCAIETRPMARCSFDVFGRWDPRSAHCGAVTMAERILRKGDRLDPRGLP